MLEFELHFEPLYHRLLWGIHAENSLQQHGRPSQVDAWLASVFSYLGVIHMAPSKFHPKIFVYLTPQMQATNEKLWVDRSCHQGFQFTYIFILSFFI